MMKKTVFLVSAATWVVTGLAAAQPDFDAVEMTAYPVVGQVSYVEGAGGNIGLFVGEDGVFLIDDQYAPLTDKIVAAVRTVSDKPIRFLVNTHMHPDHTGGNENFGKMGTLIFGHDNVRAQMAKACYDQDPPLVTYGDDMSFPSCPKIQTNSRPASQAGRNGWSGGRLCSGPPIAEPMPRRRVSTNFENTSRIPAFGSVRGFGHDAD